MPKSLNLTEQTIGYWKVHEKLIGVKPTKYRCTCTLCGDEHEVLSNKLTSGKSKACSKCAAKLNALNNRVKLEGTHMHQFDILEYVGDSTYLCRCTCGNLQNVKTSDLNSGKITQCKKCSNKSRADKMREHLEETEVGSLKVQEYIGNHYYKCLCKCGNTQNIHAYLLKNKIVTMCRECSDKIRKNTYRNTMYERYKEISSARINNPRQDWQLEILNDKRMLDLFIQELAKDLGRLPTSNELANKLDISVHILLTYTRQYHINLYTGEISKYELELRELLKDEDIIYNNRTVIYPNELDLYLPNKNIAIEFNGNYWHSDLFKDSTYHQNKTIQCKNIGVSLIHIFEYEWNDDNKKKKIINLLNRLCKSDTMNKIYARNCEVTEVSKEIAKEFINKYHIQNYYASTVNIAIKVGETIIGMMTFGKPRFNNSYEYELIRLCYMDNILVIGGTEKMFNYFTEKYKPSSIISYCDISKFNGNTYVKLGFNIENITKPNYVWVDTSKDIVLTRYQTMKSKLIENNIGTEEQTEDEIMYSLGFNKIYDCGNLKLIWTAS